MLTSLTTFVSCTDDEIDSQIDDLITNNDNVDDEEIEEEEEEVVVVFTVSAISDYIAAAAGSTATFTVTSSTAWSIADDSYFSCSPASGDGSDSAVTVTVSAIAANETFNEIESTLTVTNGEGTQKTVTVIQSVDPNMALEFGSMESTDVVSGGETISIPVNSSLSGWSVECSLSEATIAYSDAAIELTVPANFTFDVRSIELTLSVGDLVAAESLTLYQATDIYYWYGNESVDYTINEDGSMTANQSETVADVRIATYSNLGYGTYTIVVDPLNIVDTSANMIVQGWSDASTTAYTITLAGASTQASLIYKPSGAWSGTYAPADSYTINGVSKFTLTILPTADGGSEAIIYMDDVALITNTNANAWVDDIPIIFGLNVKGDGTNGYNSITYKSFTFEPYAE